MLLLANVGDVLLATLACLLAQQWFVFIVVIFLVDHLKL